MIQPFQDHTNANYGTINRRLVINITDWFPQTIAAAEIKSGRYFGHIKNPTLLDTMVVRVSHSRRTNTVR